MTSSSDMYTPDKVTIRSGRVRLDGYLGISLSPLGGVVFAHGRGRPDRAEAYLQSMTAPTMLIVGGDDVAGHRNESSSLPTPLLPQTACDRTWRDASLRRTRHTCTGREVCAHLVSATC